MSNKQINSSESTQCAMGKEVNAKGSGGHRTAICSALALGMTLAVAAYAAPGHKDNGGNHGHHGGHHKQQSEDHHGSHGAGHHGSMEGHHGHGSGHGHGSSKAGKPGQENEVDRTVKVEANDNMRFIHDPLLVSDGETIKFVITNTGAIAHEFSIGTKDEHKAHGKMMMANPDMHHGPGGASITVAPGETETLIWSFAKAGKVEAACNMPGHYQAGMHSPVRFAP